jgi:hypothetical protein
MTLLVSHVVPSVDRIAFSHILPYPPKNKTQKSSIPSSLGQKKKTHHYMNSSVWPIKGFKFTENKLWDNIYIP